MDNHWLQNSVSRQFLANTIATLSEQLITINNVVNDLLSDESATVTNQVDSPIQRCNETLFTKQLINSIRGNVVCAHRHDFIGDNNIHNYQYQSKSIGGQSSEQSQMRQQQYCYEQQQQKHQQQPPQQQMLHRHSLSSTRTMNDIKAIGEIVNLDIEKCGTISTHDCDSNYNSTATATYNTIHRQCDGINKCTARHDVKNDNCNYTNKRKNHKHSKRTTPTSPISIDTFDSNSNSSIKSNDRLNIDSMIDTAPISMTQAPVHTQFDKHTQISRNEWWKKLVIVICYLFLLSSSLQICGANKHEGRWQFLFFVLFSHRFTFFR